MPSVVADTHTIIWYFLESQSLSRNALAALDDTLNGGYRIHLASISLVEMVYLVEKSRMPEVGSSTPYMSPMLAYSLPL